MLERRTSSRTNRGATANLESNPFPGLSIFALKLTGTVAESGCTFSVQYLSDLSLSLYQTSTTEVEEVPVHSSPDQYPQRTKQTFRQVSPHPYNMELAKCLAPAIVLLKACYTLLILGYASSASVSLEGCPLIAPLSSYAPSVRSVGLSPVTSQVAAKLDSIVSSFISDHSIPFYAVSVVHAGQTVYTSGLATSPFMIGSITKTFTALGALILRERGLLSLDDPVKKFLPNFTVINPYEPHDITLRELMGHVSGLPRELCLAQCPVEEADVLKSVALMQLVRPPWSREPSYSNLGFGLLGHSWEKATSPSKTWDEFVVEDILKPMGMSSTGLDLTNVTLVTNLSAAVFDIGWVAPAGIMYSTATDLAKYLNFLLKAQPALISAATIREWTYSRTIFPDGNGGFALPWELATINSTGKEFLIIKTGVIGQYLSIIAIHPPTQLGFSALVVYNGSSLPSIGVLMLEVLNYLIPLVEQETAAIIDPLYTGHYVCKASKAPFFIPRLNITAEVLGGFIDIVDSPSLGLSASINASLILGGQPVQEIVLLRMLLKNSTENSFWLSVDSDCLGSFGDISAGVSLTDPNRPGTDYLDEIEFDFANKTLLWPAVGAVCLKNT